MDTAIVTIKITTTGRMLDTNCLEIESPALACASGKATLSRRAVCEVETGTPTEIAAVDVSAGVTEDDACARDTTGNSGASSIPYV